MLRWYYGTVDTDYYYVYVLVNRGWMFSFWFHIIK